MQQPLKSPRVQFSAFYRFFIAESYECVPCLQHSLYRMDLILEPLDKYVFSPYVYPANLLETDPVRQFISFWLITTFGGGLMVLIPDAINYFFFFDHSLMKHKRFLPNQVRKEIMYTLWSIPYMAIPTAMMFVLENQGYSKLYENVSDHAWGWWYIVMTLPCFLFFTDMCIYWIHRWLHHPLIYGPIHKDHHQWVICTPFASHAFHPIDGFLQSFPYHLYAFLFPLHKTFYLILFIAVNFWTVSIHDEIYMVPNFLKPFINGSAHHTDHHTDFNYNYGQYFTLWDRIGGSFKEPSGHIPGASVYDQLARQLKGIEEEDPLHGIDPVDRDEYIKKNGLQAKVSTKSKKAD